VELLYISSGSFVIYADNVRYDVAEGDMVLFRSNTIHKVLAKEDPVNEYYILKIHPSLIFDVAQEELAPAYVIEMSVNKEGSRCLFEKEELDSTDVPRLFSLIAKEMVTKGDCYDVAVRAYAAEVLLFVIRHVKQRESLLREGMGHARCIYRVIDYINKNYSDDVSAQECAVMANMSYSHFSRTFSSVIGKSFKDYLNGVRIDRAEKMLLTTDRSVTEVATECGYNSVSYFIMCFKAQKGVTPLECRKREKALLI
jgi:AraC-like DNA-binding protein